MLLRHADVLSEVVAGEAVVIHLGTGRYYALDRAGTAVWEAVSGAAVSDATASPVAAFVDRLVEEQLLVVGAGAAVASALDAGLDGAEPGMRAFDDLADLLLVDPIHDVTVDDLGFPTVRDR